MDFELIFYLARDTEETLECVEDLLDSMGQSLANACVTQTPKDLALMLSEAVARSQIVIVSGGLLRADQFNTINVISRALEIPLDVKPGYDTPNQRNALTLSGGVILPDADGGMDGCALTSGIQTIFLLPDTPDVLEHMLRTSVANYLEERYNLSVRAGQKPNKKKNLPAVTAGEKSNRTGRTDYEFYEKYPSEEKKSPVTDLVLYSDSKKNFSEEEPPMGLYTSRRKDREGKKKSLFSRAMRRPAFAAVFALCILVLVVVGLFQGYELAGRLKTAAQSEQTYELVRQMYGKTSNMTLPSGTLEKFGRLYEENSDVRGWINIPGTGVNYPVVQSAAPDGFYTQRDFTKTANKYGTPYFDFNNSIYRDSGNLIVYGANHGDGSMFSELNNYQRPEYYLANNLVELDTLQEEMKWQVFSVCLVDSGAKTSEFDYTQWEELGDYEFAEFVYQLRVRSQIISGVNVGSKDRLLLMVTDSDAFAGAQVVVAAVQYVGEPTVVTVDTLLSVKNGQPLMPQKWYDKNGGTPPTLEEGDYLLMLQEAEKEHGFASDVPSSKPSATASGTGSEDPASASSGSEPKEPEVVKILKVNDGGKVVTGTPMDIISRIVAAEMGEKYSPEALKAQAVAAYTNVLWEMNRGITPSVSLKKAGANVKAAVQTVLGAKMEVGGKIAYTPYFPLSAGKTASNLSVFGTELSHLVPVDSVWDKEMNGYKVSTTISAAKIKARMYSAFGVSLSGDAADWVRIIDQDGTAGYVTGVRVGTSTFSGYKFAGALGLQSHAFTIEYKSASHSFEITAYGVGHGVGMSQAGAEALAKQGKTYQEILKYYYTGVAVVQG